MMAGKALTKASALCAAAAVVLAIASGPRAEAAGERSNIRGMSMARTFAATSRGLDAVGINPGNLAFPDRGTVTLSLLPLGFHLGSDFLDYEMYTSYFTGVDVDSGRVGRYLTEQDKDRILSAFGEGDGLATFDIEARLLGFSLRLEKVGTFALTVTEQFAGFVNIPRDYVSFLLKGNPPGSFLNFDGTQVRISWTREYALSFGRMIPRLRFLKSLGAGISMKYLQGFSYFDVEKFSGSLTTSDQGTLTGRLAYHARSAGSDPAQYRNLSAYQLFAEPAATGYACDLGFAGAFTDYLFFGVSLTDLGTLTWKKDARETVVDTVLAIDDPLAASQRDAVEQALQARKRDVASFSSMLPTQLRMGLALQVDKLSDEFPGTMVIALDYNQGFNNTPGSTRSPRFSLGVEYAPVEWLPLRTGLSAGGTDHVNLALGFGVDLGAFSLEIGSENVTWLFVPRSFSYGSASIGMRFRF